MNTKTDIPNLSDKDYYFLSQNTYNEKIMQEAYENKIPIQVRSKSFYVDKIKKDPDTGLDVYVFVQAKKKKVNGLNQKSLRMLS